MDYSRDKQIALCPRCLATAVPSALAPPTSQAAWQLNIAAAARHYEKELILLTGDAVYLPLGDVDGGDAYGVAEPLENLQRQMRQPVRPAREENLLVNRIIALERKKIVGAQCAPTVDIPRPESISAPIQRAECGICMNHPPQVVFVPCGHIIACENCASQVQKCPTCRAHIDRSVSFIVSVRGVVGA